MLRTVVSWDSWWRVRRVEELGVLLGRCRWFRNQAHGCSFVRRRVGWVGCCHRGYSRRTAIYRHIGIGGQCQCRNMLGGWRSMGEERFYDFGVCDLDRYKDKSFLIHYS